MCKRAAIHDTGAGPSAAKQSTPRNRLLGSLCLVLGVLSATIAGCDYLVPPFIFDNPLDPNISYGFIESHGSRAIHRSAFAVNDEQGVALVATDEFGPPGINVIDLATGSRSYHHEPVNDWINSLACGRDGYFYIATYREIYRMSGPHTNPERLFDIGDDRHIDEIAIHPDGTIYLRVWRHSEQRRYIERYDSGGNLWGAIDLDELDPRSMSVSWSRLFVLSNNHNAVFEIDGALTEVTREILWHDGDGQYYNNDVTPGPGTYDYGHINGANLSYNEYDGLLYVHTWHHSPVVVFDPDNYSNPLIAEDGNFSEFGDVNWNRACTSIQSPGNFYVVDAMNGNLLHYEYPARSVTQRYAGREPSPSEAYEYRGLAAGASGYLYLIEPFLRRLSGFDSETGSWYIMRDLEDDPNGMGGADGIEYIDGDLYITAGDRINRYSLQSALDSTYEESWISADNRGIRDTTWSEDRMVGVDAWPLDFFEFIPGGASLGPFRPAIEGDSSDQFYDEAYLDTAPDGTTYLCVSNSEYAFIGTVDTATYEIVVVWDSREDPSITSILQRQPDLFRNFGGTLVRGFAVPDDHSMWLIIGKISGAVRMSRDDPQVLGSLSLHPEFDPDRWLVGEIGIFSIAPWDSGHWWDHSPYEIEFDASGNWYSIDHTAVERYSVN